MRSADIYQGVNYIWMLRQVALSAYPTGRNASVDHGMIMECIVKVNVIDDLIIMCLYPMQIPTSTLSRSNATTATATATATSKMHRSAWGSRHAQFRV
jgi:hypothetical protein